MQRAGAHGLDREWHIAMACDHYHHRTYRSLLQLANQVKPAHPRQADIDQQAHRPVQLHLRKELLPQGRVAEGAPPAGGDGGRVLLHAAHPGAEVRGLEMHGNAPGADELGERVRDLLPEPLLDGEPP